MQPDSVYDDTSSSFDSAAQTTGPTSVRSAQRLFLAGVGAVAEAYDEANQQFERFLDRGEQVQREWLDRTDDLRRQNARASGRMRDYFRGAMDMVLDTFNVPSRTDVDTINVKLNILTRKIDDLQMQSLDRDGSPIAPKATSPTTEESDPPLTGDLAT